jgi:hypothetical protein
MDVNGQKPSSNRLQKISQTRVVGTGLKGRAANDRQSEAPTRILDQHDVTKTSQKRRRNVTKTSQKRHQPNGKSGFELTSTSFLER